MIPCLTLCLINTHTFCYFVFQLRVVETYGLSQLLVRLYSKNMVWIKNVVSEQILIVERKNKSSMSACLTFIGAE